MITDFRALCAELARVLELSIDSPGDFDVAAFELIYVARTALALAEPEPEGPTDEEIMELMPQQTHHPATHEHLRQR